MYIFLLVSALKKRTSEQHTNEMFNRQGFKLKHMQIMYFCDYSV